eukprot:PITA_19736
MENPQMRFLQETKCNSATLGRILSKAWPGCRSVAMDATGASGGLAIAWNTQADAGSKRVLLDTIEALSINRQHPLWIAAGDFNMITKIEDKIGGKSRLEPEVDHFKDFIQNASLIDMSFCNGTFTWSNRRSGKHQIASKLDRFLISDNAVHLGGDLTAEILAHSGSDH